MCNAYLPKTSCQVLHYITLLTDPQMKLANKLYIFILFLGKTFPYEHRNIAWQVH